jgi:hypothetical protein
VLFKQRQVRRSSKFSSRMRGSSRQRREYAATVYSTAFIQVILAVTLIVAGIRSYQAVSAHGDTLPLPLKLALPVVFVVAGLISARSALRNVRSAHSMFSRRPARDDRDEDDDAPPSGRIRDPR